MIGSNPVVGPYTAHSYWIYPQSCGSSYGRATADNSTFVVIGPIFGDCTNLRDSCAVDQRCNRMQPVSQRGHLAPDTWNYVTSDIGAVAAGKTIVRLEVGFDRATAAGGYRGCIDDIATR